MTASWCYGRRCTIRLLRSTTEKPSIDDGVCSRHRPTNRYLSLLVFKWQSTGKKLHYLGSCFHAYYPLQTIWRAELMLTCFPNNKMLHFMVHAYPSGWLMIKAVYISRCNSQTSFLVNYLYIVYLRLGKVKCLICCKRHYTWSVA